MISVENILKIKPEFKGSYVDGAWRKAKRPNGSWEIVSPANIDWALPSVSFSFEDVSTAVGSGKQAFRLWSKMELNKRLEFLKRFGQELVKRADLMAHYMAIETGKPYDECLAEVKQLPTRIDVTIEDGLKLVQSQQVDLGAQGVAEICYRPKGLLLVIGPAILSLNLPHGHIVPALIMGNTVIFKPSEKIPYTAQTYMEAAEAAGFPKGVLQLVHGEVETSTRLVRDLDVDGILATCSFDVGAKIQKEVAEKPQKIVALEMGGKNAALVWRGADLDKCAESLVRSAFMSTGQRCTALSRVFCEPSIMQELVGKVHAMSKEIVISQPFDEDPKPFMGPLISATSKERFLRYNTIAESEGAELIMRPKSLEGATRQNRKPLPPGHYVTPAINIIPRWDAKSAYQTHEILGPDIFFCSVESLEEGVAAVNSAGYGLVCSVYGGTEDIFKEVSDGVEAGLIYWNRGTVGGSARIPFGGWKKSGNHRPAGTFAIYSTSQVQVRIRS